jgi:hypothetical protein
MASAVQERRQAPADGPGRAGKEDPVTHHRYSVDTVRQSGRCTPITFRFSENQLWRRRINTDTAAHWNRLAAPEPYLNFGRPNVRWGLFSEVATAPDDVR